jgi:uncharacterized protein (DUF433 family)
MDFKKYFVRNPKIMGGETVFAGTRVPLRTVLGSLAAGHAPEAIMREFPTVTPEHMRAAIAFAAEAAHEDLPPASSVAA